MGKVVFSDESKFNRLGSDGICYVRRRNGEELNPSCAQRTVKGGGSVIAWTATSRRAPGPIHRILVTMDQPLHADILENMMNRCTRKKMGRGFIFQHDNDPKQTSSKVKQWLEAKRIKVLKWPAQAPDLNPLNTFVAT